MPKNDRCPDCNVKWADHSEYTPKPSKWLAGDILTAATETSWRFNPSGAQDCCGVSLLAATVNRRAIPSRHAWHVVVPLLLWDLSQHGLPVGVLREVLGVVWARAATPLKTMTSDQWRTLFEAAGYTSGTSSEPLRAADRPACPQVLYRAADEEFKDNFSWTQSRELADEYVERNRAAGVAGRSRVWWAVVEPWRLWCRVVDIEEYVVDTRGLEIHALDEGEPPDIGVRALVERPATPSR